MSVDLRSIKPSSRELLLNKYAIAVDQDALGKQGQLRKQVCSLINYFLLQLSAVMSTQYFHVKISNTAQLWVKPILPRGSFAFVVLNLDNMGTPSK